MRKSITTGQLKRIVWLDMQRLSTKQIADRLEIGVSTVSMWLRKMREDGMYDRFKRELKNGEPVSFDDCTPVEASADRPTASAVYAVERQLQETQQELERNYENVQALLEKREQLRDDLKRLSAWLEIFKKHK